MTIKQNSSEQQNKDHTSWAETPFLALKGFLMGSADIVPGVSGGTMALIVGIYNRLIHAISSFDLTFIKCFFTFRWKSAFKRAHWKFMASLLCGIFCAAIFFTKVIPLQTYMFTDPEVVFGLFFGLIIGSIFILCRAIDDFSWWHGLYILAGMIIGLWVVTRVPADTSESSLFIFISGAIAICAMVLPGISGSYILLILHKYDYILSQVSTLGTTNTISALWILAPFILGAIVGLMLFTRLLSWLLDHFYAGTLAVLIGFLVGSLYVIWPYQNRHYTKFVKKTEIIAYNSKRAQQLRTHPAKRMQPEYQRFAGVINQDDKSEEQKKVKIETVKQKLVKSHPYIPYLTVQGVKTNHLWSGIMSMIIGVALVSGLEFLQQKE